MTIAQTENGRNFKCQALFERMLKKAWPDVSMVACGHHIFFRRGDGPVEELPSADALLFSHEIAKRVWGPGWKGVIRALAIEPEETRGEYAASLLDRLETFNA